MAHESILACLQGRTVYDLGVELYPGMPHHPFHAPFTFQLMREHGDLVFGGGVSSAVELFGMTGHTGTHLDGLGHFAKNLCLHGGISATDVQSKFETAYLAALAKVRAYVIDLQGDLNTLTLGDESGNTLMRYTLGSTSVTGVKWVATGINNGKQALVSTVAGSTVTMELNDKGEVTGNATCNTYNGTYTVDGDKIEFGPLMTTKMACESDELNAQEQAYLLALDNTTTWELANGVLTFRDDSGAMQATYTAE